MNADVSSTAIASKYEIPLPTIPRRRAILESMSVLKHECKPDHISFDLRTVDVLGDG
jgi:hypothetical protein